MFSGTQILGRSPRKTAHEASEAFFRRKNEHRYVGAPLLSLFAIEIQFIESRLWKKTCVLDSLCFLGVNALGV